MKELIVDKMYIRLWARTINLQNFTYFGFRVSSTRHIYFKIVLFVSLNNVFSLIIITLCQYLFTILLPFITNDFVWFFVFFDHCRICIGDCDASTITKKKILRTRHVFIAKLHTEGKTTRENLVSIISIAFYFRK